eukprot:1158745-Rhodomonas_salina.1
MRANDALTHLPCAPLNNFHSRPTSTPARLPAALAPGVAQIKMDEIAPCTAASLPTVTHQAPMLFDTSQLEDGLAPCTLQAPQPAFWHHSTGIPSTST